MRILFIAIASSIHTVRWIDQISALGWDIHLFPSHDSATNTSLHDLTLHDGIVRLPDLPATVRQNGALLPWPSATQAAFLDRGFKFLRRSSPLNRWLPSPERRLANLIKRLKPDIIHSMEMQFAGYLTLKARSLMDHDFPPWIITIWGSDLVLYSQLAEHEERIRHALGACEYFWCECQRDADLARKLGFNGELLPLIPVYGGYDTELIASLRSSSPTSSRRLVLLKGYQNWSGRALVGLHALELCATELLQKEYRVVIYLANPDVELAARVFSRRTGITVEIIPPSPHTEILKYFNLARISIGLSISDGLPASVLEAMAMGAFPIQSCTGCAQEWLLDGQTGLIVPPEDPDKVADAIRRALADDDLVDHAAEENTRLIAARLDKRIISPKIADIYQHIIQNRPAD